jgi:hypothetical protein
MNLGRMFEIPEFQPIPFWAWSLALFGFVVVLLVELLLALSLLVLWLLL